MVTKPGVDTSENELHGADDSSSVIKSKHQDKTQSQQKYVLFQNQVRMATGNAGAAALNNSASDPQQQSKPHLPKNAHITGKEVDRLEEEIELRLSLVETTEALNIVLADYPLTNDFNQENEILQKR